jgi:hypothetical protein
MTPRRPPSPALRPRSAGAVRTEGDPRPLDELFALHSFSNFMLIGGDYDAVKELDRTLRQAPRLAWRPAEDVEREVVYLAMKLSQKRIEALDLEAVLQACEAVEGRHLIDNGAIARHFRNMWHASAAYSRAFMRGLLALKPGEGAPPAALATARENFSLTRMVLPPYRILQGSYRYAGRTWCSRNWGTPEDARLISVRRLQAAPGMAEMVYEFETMDGAPVGALKRLIERQPALAISCLSVDRGIGLRILTAGGAGRGVKVRELDPIDMSGESETRELTRRNSVQLAREALHGLMEAAGKRGLRRRPAAGDSAPRAEPDAAEN